MTSKDLIHVANILLDCEEMDETLGHIQKQCRRFGLKEVQQDIISIVKKCKTVYTIGTVTYDYDEGTTV
jgi:hypothetical protein